MTCEGIYALSGLLFGVTSLLQARKKNSEIGKSAGKDGDCRWQLEMSLDISMFDTVSVLSSGIRRTIIMIGWRIPLIFDTPDS